MSLDHSSRRECVATAFQLLLKHEGECRGMEVRRLSPNVFLWGALALTGKHRVDRLEANLRADIAAEFLIDEAAARQGITKEFAVHQFDKDADICSLGEGDFLYFFGVENDTIKPSAPEDDVIIGGVATADLLLFRSVPLISEPLAFLATFLDARLLFVRSMRVLVDAEKLSRRELQDVEITSRDELQSTSRRRMYAAALRTRLAEDRKLAQQEYALKSVDDDSKKDAVELQNLKWEQEAVQRSIEATRDAAVKLELCLQDTHHYVRRCGDHFGVFKQYKDTLLQLCANEVQDDVQSTMAAIHTHHDKWGGRFDAIEDKVREVGRMMLLTSAGARGRVHHAATLEACNVAHKRTHDGQPLDFSWLLDTARPRVMAAEQPLHDDETIARWMLRDPTIFVPQSVLGPHQSLQLTKDSVGVIQRVFNRLASISAVDAATVTNYSSLPSAKVAGSSKTPANSNAPSISLPVFRDFCKATGLCSAVKDSLTLEFESFCPVDRNMMDYEGWLQCLASQSTLMFPRFAANISRPLLMDIMCTSLLVPWLHADASRGDLSTSPIPHSSDAAGSRSVVVRSIYSQRRQSLCFDIKELAEECFGALLASHRTLEMFLQYFSTQAADYPAAPAARVGNVFLRSVDLMSLSRMSDAQAPSPADCEAPALLQALQLGSNSLTIMRNVLNHRIAVSHSLLKGGGCDATVDACCGWLSVRLPLDGACPPRHVILLLLADCLVRIVQASFASRTEGPLSLWPHSSVSSLLFDGSILPAMLDVAHAEWTAAASLVSEEASIHVESTCISVVMFMSMIALLSHEVPSVIPSLEDIMSSLCGS